MRRGKTYLIMDDRARTDVDEADVLDTADTLREARIVRDAIGGVIVSADQKGEKLENLTVVE